ncbi:MAG TPA: hypothetical protein VGC37_15840 [Friedmanniella sp.]
MTGTGSVPLELDVDLRHGGRWTSLRTAEREWLWTRPDPAVAPARAAARPGDRFVDAGGVEECFPTVRGTPDHGDAWSRAWTGPAADASVVIGDGTRLRRTITRAREAVTIGYEVTGEPGTPFVHAVHALLDLSPSARLVVPGARSMTLLDVDDPVRSWPAGLDLLGPDDGTAVCAIVPGCHEATVVDGVHALRFAWTSEQHHDLCSLMLWRNLGGWPAEGPYRSIGIEPTIGRAADLETPDARTAHLDASGRAAWTLSLTGQRSRGGRIGFEAAAT